MGRVRKRQVQQSFSLFAKTLDKNGQLRGSRKGEKRGKRLVRPSEPHTTRPVLRASEPVHVVMRAHEAIGSLRKRDVFHAIREALITVYRLEDSFRIIHFSVQRSHLHLLVEASDRLALAKGMQVFGISAAMHINSCLRDTAGRRRRGPVFPDRYYARILRQPRDVRNTLAYILNNWKHHRADRGSTWVVDPFSSAIMFEGWKERADHDGRFLQPPGYLITPLVSEAKSWLVRVGWRKRGLISVHEVLGGDE